MSITAFLSTIGGFLSGPIMTGISNVASLGTLGVSIATKVDTHEIKTTTSGIRSDIATLDRDILALAGDISDMRQERYWSLALAGETPVAVTAGGQPTAVQLQLATPTVPVQQSTPQVQPVPTQTIQQSQPVVQQVVPTSSTPTTPVQPTQPAPVQTVTVAAPADQNQIAAFIAAMPEIIAKAVKAAMTPPPTTTTTTPETTTTTTSAPVTTPPATN